jgi:hypothetical protein
MLLELRAAAQARHQYARCAGVNERLDTCCDGFFQEIQGAFDVEVDKFLPTSGSNMRLVQGGGMEHRLNASHAAPHP